MPCYPISWLKQSLTLSQFPLGSCEFTAWIFASFYFYTSRKSHLTQASAIDLKCFHKTVWYVNIWSLLSCMFTSCSQAVWAEIYIYYCPVRGIARLHQGKVLLPGQLSRYASCDKVGAWKGDKTPEQQQMLLVQKGGGEAFSQGWF